MQTRTSSLLLLFRCYTFGITFCHQFFFVALWRCSRSNSSVPTSLMVSLTRFEDPAITGAQCAGVCECGMCVPADSL
uniref:Putative secreted protein n=1 Tax=Anopheles darlingi TaxID=43151 RepID=A0A2M4DGF7_ANODA